MKRRQFIKQLGWLGALPFLPNDWTTEDLGEASGPDFNTVMNRSGGENIMVITEPTTLENVTIKGCTIYGWQNVAIGNNVTIINCVIHL